MKRWEIQSTTNTKQPTNEELIKLLLKNRGLTTQKEIEEFLNPHFEEVTIENVNIDKKQLQKTLKRLSQAMEKKEQIIVFGDYDVDGITGTAILWETLHKLGAKVLPYIPHRIDEGYGLSKPGITNVTEQTANVKLIITVDNGIVAKEAVDFANEQGIDVIITDHHTKDEQLPKAFSIVHTTKLCGAGVAYLLSKEIKKFVIPDLIGDPKTTIRNSTETRMELDSRLRGNDNEDDSHLELATLGTIADLVPLVGANRTLVKHGLPKLSKTQRPGLQELFKLAGITKTDLDVYEIGFLIGPRLNAAGRMESAMDSLRLLCTKDRAKAQTLAAKLESINKDRQYHMKEAAQHASLLVKSQDSLKKILIISHETYQQGVIGLIAGKLVEEFYRPAIVLSQGEKYSKASVRSISGFNIIEFLRSQPHLFVNVGGHPMAAGFTIETEKLLLLKETLETLAENLIDEQTLTRLIKIDCEIPFSIITQTLYSDLQQLAPFGMNNPTPIFATKNVKIVDMRVLGKESNHLKLNLRADNTSLESIGFGFGELAHELKRGDEIDIAYNIDINEWNGNKKLQLKIKDLKISA